MSMSEEIRGAILQRDKLTYAIVPRTPAGMVSPEVLEAISRVVRKYKIPIMKITSGQRLALVGIKQEDVDSVWQDLKIDVGRAIELCVHYVQACPGVAVCRYGVQDSLGLGLELEEKFLEMELPAKVKMGVSGCPMCCGESYVRDIGLVGKKSGWTLSFGGNSGSRPRIGDVLAEDLSRNEAVVSVGSCLEYWVKNGKKRERTARFIERTGIEAMKKVLGRS
ncbi:MAG: sulfite reductase, assimilatory-type [Deltaproteobacteria bacterium RIFOXYD12_FULL_50_9]|nr:MAG: sulfite reductase, assimilatory-type [Deltaproteobacteria bacterium RIFOXYD12_FULL_50_9]